MFYLKYKFKEIDILAYKNYTGNNIIDIVELIKFEYNNQNYINYYNDAIIKYNKKVINNFIRKCKSKRFLTQINLDKLAYDFYLMPNDYYDFISECFIYDDFLVKNFTKQEYYTKANNIIRIIKLNNLFK